MNKKPPILVVEDDDIVQKQISGALEDEGYKVICSASAEKATHKSAGKGRITIKEPYNDFHVYAMEWDEKQHFPVDLFKKMGELGMLGVFVPTEYGGAGFGWSRASLRVRWSTRALG